MNKKNWCVADYDYTKTYPDIDYSERITESGLVLSMREIYNRYAAMGVDVLHGEYVDDEEDPDATLINDFDDPLDMLQSSYAIKNYEAPPKKRKQRQPSGQPDKTPAGKSVTPVSPNDAPAPPAPAAEPGASSRRQNEAQRSDGAYE